MPRIPADRDGGDIEVCGIAGFRDFQNASGRGELLAMTSVLRHRGPDEEGYWLSASDGIGLGHERLAIIDLSSAAAQPMVANMRSVVVTYNGEIYNYREVREDLERCGHRFRTASDTEVLLTAYSEWGTACFKRFRGMFAFALWDSVRRELLLVRDRFGVKPLYYSRQKDLLLFGSELKSLMAHPRFVRELNPGAVASYFSLGYVCAPNTIFRNTWKVSPGSYLRVAADGSVSEVRWWEPPHAEAGDSEPSAAVVEGLRRLLHSAASYRLVSDVPVGVLLSGGVDSSLVAAMLAKEEGRELMSFTLKFTDSNRDESAWAMQVARCLETDHHEIRCSERDALEIVPQLAGVYDEPLADPSAVPTLLLCRGVREHVKVALSGDGGDELFGGYLSYQIVARLWRAGSLLPLPVNHAAQFTTRLAPGVMGRVGAVIAGKSFFKSTNHVGLEDRIRKGSRVIASASLVDAYETFVRIWSQEEVATLVPGVQAAGMFDGSWWRDEAVPRTMMSIDARTYLPDDVLTKVDRAAMSVGLEVREPLLDHDVAEYAAGLHPDLLVRNGVGKWILREILASYIPRPIVDRRKQGFSPPLGRWLHGPLRPLVAEALRPARLATSGAIDPDAAVRVVRDFYEKNSVDPRKVWSLLIFQLWCERWLRNSS